MNIDVFCEYANYYDSLYPDKDYQAECNFIKSIFEAYSKRKVKTVLDLGCGTGSHAILLSKMGYAITGVDVSRDMLEIAKEKVECQSDITFLQQDIRNLKLPQKFDAVIAMFAVMGYQTENRDFESTLASVRHHLSLGGLFIFDVWFGLAVLAQKPEARTKTIRLGGKKIIRHAHPVLDSLKQTVAVNYTVSEISGNKLIKETMESHFMRFFFYQELVYFLEKNGFEVLRICPFMDLKGTPDESCWNISVISRCSD